MVISQGSQLKFSILSGHAGNLSWIYSHLLSCCGISQSVAAQFPGIDQRNPYICMGKRPFVIEYQYLSAGGLI